MNLRKFAKYVLTHSMFPSFIKRMIFRRFGTIGQNLKIGSGSFIYSKNITIGHNVTIEREVIITGDIVHIGNDVVIQKETFIIGKKRVQIGDDCKIAHRVTIGGGQTSKSEIIMGERVQVYPYAILNTTFPLIIEDDVGVGNNTYIFTHGSWQDAYEGFPYTFAPVTIKKNAWLPPRVYVMPGITIGEEATIGSDALITKDIPARSFAAGVPAKILKTGAEYIKVMDDDAKYSLMEAIFIDFADSQKTFNKQESVFSREGKTLILDFQNGKVIYDLHPTIGGSDRVVILTEQDISEEPTQHVFDLKNKRCRWPFTPLEADLHSFITGYGIRLKIAGKYA